jgi:aminoglycoside phosphotransferase (APT) family kinase protein
MQPVDIAKQLAGGGKVQEITRGTNRVFRIWPEGGQASLIKVYSSPTHERRERRALAALAGIEGVPQVVDRGSTDDFSWVKFDDPGTWSLASLPESPGASRRAGQVLHAVHKADQEALSNLSGGMDAEWLAQDFRSTFERLERYRRKLQIPPELIKKALTVDPPPCGEPRASHTNPRPESFLVDESGQVTLIDWEWATLAPPEWDFSLATWLLRLQAGPGAASALAEGYGAALSEEDLDAWIAYHAGMILLREAETRDGRLDSLSYMVDELRRVLSR